MKFMAGWVALTWGALTITSAAVAVSVDNPKPKHAQVTAAKPGGGKTTAVKTAGGKGKTKAASKRAGARKRAVKGPSYQTHPDPERYRQIQQALAGRGYYKGEVNGEWNDDSVDALKRFQADQKLDDDGKLSALTLRGLGLGPKHDGSTAPLSGTAAITPVEPPPVPTEEPPPEPPE